MEIASQKGLSLATCNQFQIWLKEDKALFVSFRKSSERGGPGLVWFFLVFWTGSHFLSFILGVLRKEGGVQGCSSQLSKFLI